MSSDFPLLRALIREEMEYYGKHMGRGPKGLSLGTSSGAEVEIDAWMEQLKQVEGEIQQLEATPQRLYGPQDTQKIQALQKKKADIEFQIKSLQEVL